MDEDERRPRRALPLAAVAVTFVLLESIRIWFPSILFIAGAPGDTPAPLLAAGVVVALLVPVAAAGLVDRIGTRTIWAVGGLGLVVGRAALIAFGGGTPQLVASTVAVIGGTLALTALAAGSIADDRTRVGVLAGLAAAVVVHVGTRTLGLVWQDGVVAIAASIAVVLVLVVALRSAAARLRSPVAPSSGAAWPWLVLAPLFLLVGQISGVPGRLAVATGWSPPVVATVVAAAHVAAVLAALLGPWLGPLRAGRTGAATVLVGTAASLQAVGWPSVVGQVLIPIGFGLIVGADPDGIGTPTTGRRRGRYAAVAMLLFGALTALYYLSYDVALPLNNRWLLLLAALLAGAVGLAIARVGRTRTTRASLDLASAARLSVLAVVVVATVTIATGGPPRDAPGPPDDRLRVAVLNARSGFDAAGRFAPVEQARALRDYAPDVVVLNEVDRGWWATGGHDALALHAAELGLEHVSFAPAADEVWGNAVLSRFPILERSAERLPSGSDPMGRSELATVLELDDGRQLGVVGAHLSHVDDQGDTRVPQARSVAATAARFRERGIPTIVAGDLNAEPGSPELATFEPLLTKTVPDGSATYPSHAPTEQRQHVLASSDLRRVSVQIPTTSVSDHLPVVVTLELEPTPDP